MSVPSNARRMGDDFRFLESDLHRVGEGHVPFVVSIVDQEMDLFLVFIVLDDSLVRSGHGDVMLVSVSRDKKGKERESSFIFVNDQIVGVSRSECVMALVTKDHSNRFRERDMHRGTPRQTSSRDCNLTKRSASQPAFARRP